MDKDDILIIKCPKCRVEVFNIDYRGRDMWRAGVLPEHFLCRCQRCKYEFRTWMDGVEAPASALAEKGTEING